jgi:2-keto-4-pentenoate hydratase/2-oxohepta-3-ene-1,7-dioic acid hydratase in catechol pathway
MNIFCIEQNYLPHKRERENIIPGEPIIFVKPQTALLLPDTAFKYENFDENKLYIQSEIALRISANGKDISEDNAANYYDAITVGVSFTAIDIHDELNGIEASWEKAKAWNHSSGVGNWIPIHEFKNKNDINFCLYKNREMVQLGNSELMVHGFDKIIASISKLYSLHIGDIVFTGTPLGVGEVFTGDKLEAFIEDDTLLEFEIE